MASQDLKGKSAIVTGGNSGIGKAIVLALAEAGANVVIDYVSHPEATEELERQVAALGDRAIGVEADVSKVEDLQRLIDAAVKAFGRLDIMVNNAGVETRTSVLDTTEKQYEFVMDVNLKSAFFGTQLAAKQMIAQGGGGRIINITSVHEDWPMPGNTPYCLSKGGMRMLTRTAGIELAPHGITVNGVGPGAVDTPINAETEVGPGQAAHARRGHPARAHGQARGDRQRGGLPGQRRRQLRHRHHLLRRRRHHAQQPGPLTGRVRGDECTEGVRHRVVVVGGGFGGLPATRLLGGKPVDVTLIDRRNHHLFQPLLYQVATGMLPPGQIAPALRHVVRRSRNVRVDLAEVTGFDLDRRIVHASTLGVRDRRDPLRQPHRGSRGHPVVLRPRRVRPLRPGHEDPRRRPRAATAHLRRLRDGRDGGRCRRTRAVAHRRHRRGRPHRGRAGRAGARAGGAKPPRRVPDLRPGHGAGSCCSTVAASRWPPSATSWPARRPRSSSTSGSSCAWGRGWSGIDAFGVDVAEADGTTTRIAARTTVWAAGVQASPLAAMLAKASGADVDRAGSHPRAP